MHHCHCHYYYLTHHSQNLRSPLWNSLYQMHSNFSLHYWYFPDGFGIDIWLPNVQTGHRTAEHTEYSRYRRYYSNRYVGITQCTYFLSVTCHPFTTSITGFTNREKYVTTIIYIENETSAHTFFWIGRIFIMIISKCFLHRFLCLGCTVSIKNTIGFINVTMNRGRF